MKTKSNLPVALIAAAIILTIGSGCKFLKSANSESNATEIGNNSGGQNSEITPTKNPDSPKVEKADFTVKSEDFDKEFTKKGAKEADLQKYASKNIAVSGRVSMLVMEKKGTVQPWVTLYAPGILGGVNCYFDDGNLEQMKLLKMDKMAKVQGFKDSFIVPEISPTLDHCVVLEGDK